MIPELHRFLECSSIVAIGTLSSAVHLVSFTSTSDTTLNGLTTMSLMASICSSYQQLKRKFPYVNLKLSARKYSSQYSSFCSPFSLKTVRDVNMKYQWPAIFDTIRSSLKVNVVGCPRQRCRPNNGPKCWIVICLDFCSSSSDIESTRTLLIRPFGSLRLCVQKYLPSSSSVFRPWLLF